LDQGEEPADQRHLYRVAFRKKVEALQLDLDAR
jgi:hypothetical protein